MGLTQVSTDGVKNDAITKTKIPANQIEASELADNAVDTNAIADQAVALSKLPHGDGSSDGKFLRANNGADPSFETVSIPAGTTINNNADNRLITGSGTANTLNGESGLTYTGQALNVNSVTSEGNAFRIYNTTDNSTRFHINGEGDYFTGNSYPRSDANMDLGFRSGYRWRDLILSGGVQLGGTGTANLLNDYEEGTFTPEYNSGSAASACFAGGVSYNSDRTGIYRKIGNMVYFFIKIQATSGTAKSGQLIINGLPFTSGNFNSNATAGGGQITLTTAFNNNSDMPTVFISGSASQIKFFFTNAGDFAGTNLPSPTGVIHLCGQYPTT